MGSSTLTPSQRRVITTLDTPVFVAAGAGSGKTFTLTQRIVWALTEGSAANGEAYLDRLDQALIITFTDKAAGEIRERVRGALHKAGMVDHALQVDSAWISTIHGMCARILRRHALELGIDPGFQVLDEGTCSEIRDRALESVFGDVEGDTRYEDLFNAYDVRGHSLEGDSKMTIAGMVDTIAEKAIAAPNGFESLSFVGEDPDVGSLMEELHASYEALCSGRIKNERERGLCNESCGLLDSYLRGTSPSSRDVESALAIVRQLHRPDGRLIRSDQRKETQALLGSVSAELELASAADLRDSLLALTHRVVDSYEEGKRDLRGVDNDDLLRHTLAAFRDHPDIAAQYVNQFRLVMVDEFQDTNAQQVEMIKLLSGENAERLTTVGDAQQSIYRFRDADVEVFRERQREVGREGVIRLDENFRSHDDILRFVQKVCDDPSVIPDFMDLAADERRKDEYVARGVPRIAIEVTSTRKIQGSAPSASDRSQAQAEQIADRLASLVAAGESPGDMALLMGSTTRAPLYIDALRSRGIDCVIAKGSTFSSAPEVGVVAALLHVLANPHDTALGLFPVLTSDMFRLDADDLCALGTRKQDVLDAPAKRSIDRGLQDMEFMPGITPSKRLLAARSVLVRAWRRMGSKPVADVCLDAIRESGWIARLERQGVEGRAQVANILAAVRHVRDLTEGMGLGVSRGSREFDHWLSVAKEPPASLAGGKLDAVRIMTIHGSKGLEFPIVAAVECCNDPVRKPSREGVIASSYGDDVLMSIRPAELSLDGVEIPVERDRCSSLAEWRGFLEARESNGELAEKGRLLYVALTRAREALILGVSVTTSASGLGPKVAATVIGSLFGGMLPEAGETRLDYGGSAPAIVRHCVLTYDEARNVQMEPGDVQACSDDEMASGEGSPFLLYEDDPQNLPKTSFWHAREGVFSYSSAHADEVGELNLTMSESGPSVRAADGGGANDDAPDPGEPAPSDDIDKATNLGSAFHELAQVMVETGAYPSQRRIDSVAGVWHVSKRQHARLMEALERWRDSAIRSEALGHMRVEAEVPFFVPVVSRHGDYLEGAIDLLATDPGSSSALVIDYKTGDADKSAEELRQCHEMQARYYAHILLDQGFVTVSCAFVCVERDDGTGEPVVVRYEFSSTERPKFE